MPSRDDFPSNIITKLGERVGLRCSNPSCRVATNGPHSEEHKAASIGKAAHIHAAARGGPRYAESQTSDQRRSAGNGIWLCSNCSALIDSDPDRYPAELLREWKRSTEVLAQASMGFFQPPPSVNIGGAHLLVSTTPRFIGSTFGIQFDTGQAPREAHAFPFGANPKIVFDLTNLGDFDIKLEGLQVDVTSFTTPPTTDFWVWTGLGRTVRRYSCNLQAQVGTYPCRSELSDNEYLVITPGELEFIRIELSVPPTEGAYELSVALSITAARDRLTRQLHFASALAVFDPAVRSPTRAPQRIPPWAR